MQTGIELFQKIFTFARGLTDSLSTMMGGYNIGLAILGFLGFFIWQMVHKSEAGAKHHIIIAIIVAAVVAIPQLLLIPLFLAALLVGLVVGALAAIGSLIGF